MERQLLGAWAMTERKPNPALVSPPWFCRSTIAVLDLPPAYYSGEGSLQRPSTPL